MPAPPLPGVSASVGKRASRFLSVVGVTDLWSLLRWAPLVPAIAYLAVLLHGARTVGQDIFTNSDTLGTMVLADALPQTQGHPSIWMGNFGGGWYTTLWLNELTRWSPSHQTLWETWPYALTLLGIALLAWAAWRIAGVWPALVTAALAVAAAPTTLFFQIAQAHHGLTYVNVCVLAAMLVYLATSGDSIFSPARMITLTVVAVITGLNVASDSLLIFAGLIPFASAPAAAAVAWRKNHSARLVEACLGAAILAGVVAVVTRHALDSAGFSTAGGPLHFVSESSVGNNVGFLFSSFLTLGNGHVFGRELDLRTLAEGLSGLLVLCAAAAVVLGLRRLHAAPPVNDVRAVYLLFWSVSATLVAAAYVASDLPGGLDSARYLVPILLAACATVPLLVAGHRSREALVAAGATLFAVLSLVGLRDSIDNNSYQSDFTRDLGPVVTYLEDHGLTRGYASYWQSGPLTWMTEQRIRAYPVLEGGFCGAPTGELCAYHLFSISSWFDARPDTPTFLIEDPNAWYVDHPPSAKLGSPSDVFTAGHITVYVYPYDIASHIKP